MSEKNFEQAIEDFFEKCGQVIENFFEAYGRIIELHDKGLDLFLQSVADGECLGGKVYVGRRVLSDLKQPVLDAQAAVLQTEI